MDRRTALQNLALVIGGAVLLPRGVKAYSDNAIEIYNLDISPAQQLVLAEVCETIIPKTTLPGSKDLRLHVFVIKMVDDCYSPDDQAAFTTGLTQMDAESNKQYGHLFSTCTKVQRESLLLSIEQKQNTYPAELNTFYRIIKDKTLQGYTNSQFFMTKQVVYELIPGSYNAHFPVKA